MLPCYQDNDVFQLSTKIGAMDFGFVSTYLIRLIFGKTKDRKYIFETGLAYDVTLISDKC